MISFVDFTMAFARVVKSIQHTYVAVFNPSIAHIADNKFLVCFRASGNRYDNPNYLDNVNNARHPWTTNWKKNVEVTFFTEVDFDTEILKIVSYNTHPGILDAEDVRIYKYKKSYLLTYNQYSDKNKTPLLYNEKYESTNANAADNFCNKDKFDKLKSRCIEDFCGHMMLTQVVLSKTNSDPDEIDQQAFEANLSIKNDKYACPSCSEKIEKNWSLWENSIDDNTKGLRISYKIAGGHTILKPTTTSLFAKCISDNVQSDITSLLGNIEEESGHTIFFSLSTPAIPLDDKLMLAIGHCKIKYNEFLKMKNLSNVLLKMQNDLKAHINLKVKTEYYPHQTYVYFMFAYTFNKDTGSVDKISNIFYFDDNESYLLYFPSGLCRVGDLYYLTYGVGDIKAKVAIIHKAFLTTLLKPADAFTGNIIIYGSNEGVRRMSVDDDDDEYIKVVRQGGRNKKRVVGPKKKTSKKK